MPQSPFPRQFKTSNPADPISLRAKAEPSPSPAACCASRPTPLAALRARIGEIRRAVGSSSRAMAGGRHRRWQSRAASAHQARRHGTPTTSCMPPRPHGDLGMITPGERVVITVEPLARRRLLTIIAPGQAPGRPPDRDDPAAFAAFRAKGRCHLDAGVAEEACRSTSRPPRAFTAASLGDALAVALLDARGFVAEGVSPLHWRPRSVAGR